MSEWSITKLGDVLEITNGYAFKSVNFRSEPEAGCLPVLKIKNVANGDVHINDVQYHHFEEKLSKYTAQKGDILISLTGNHPHAETQVVGAVSKLKMDIRAFVNQRVAKIDTKPNLADKDYIYFALKEEGLSKYLASQSSGSANQANISKADIEDLDIALPPLPEQKAIASVLSSLDDKIDLLHRQNKTLEAMAETLFRQWFIEEAKEDWEEADLTQLIGLQSGYAFKSKDFQESGNFGVIKIKNISGNIIDIEQTDFVSDEVGLATAQRFNVSSGQVLVAMTGAEIGKLGLVPKTTKKLLLNQRVGLLEPKFIGAQYLAYLHLKSEFGQDYIENSATGSAQPNISGSLIEACPFPKVEDSILQQYGKQVQIYFVKVKENLGQIQTLEQLRDTLLPKIMSGEVRIQYQTEEVA